MLDAVKPVKLNEVFERCHVNSLQPIPNTIADPVPKVVRAPGVAAQQSSLNLFSVTEYFVGCWHVANADLHLACVECVHAAPIALSITLSNSAPLT